jgi:methylated-DNA-[protein]-cysteine S-methyltransferase
MPAKAGIQYPGRTGSRSAGDYWVPAFAGTTKNSFRVGANAAPRYICTMNTNARSTEHYALFDTAIGTCAIAWSARGITRLQLPERDREAGEKRLLKRLPEATQGEPPPHVVQVIAQIQRYAAGEPVEFSDVALDIDDVPSYHRAIYDGARAVKWGETTTYGALAAKAGSPQDAREVGVALARNPVTLIIPCHRVLAAGNKMGGFSAYGGTIMKERLLALEGVTVGEPVLPGLFAAARRAG